MGTVEVVGMERLAAQEGTVALALGGITVGGRAGGLAATVIVDGALQLGVSKLDGEAEWIADSAGPVGGCPAYANGVGARYCRLKAVKAEIAAALDAAAAAMGEGHDCQENAVPYVSDGALGHGWECGICGAFLQAG